MNKRQNPLGIRVGDTVRIDLTIIKRGTFLALVSSVTDRTNMGYDASIDFIPEESGRDLFAEKHGIPYLCSVSHVTEIVKRAPGQDFSVPTVNIFRENQFTRSGEIVIFYPGGIAVSYWGIEYLVQYALVSVNCTLDRPLDMRRFIDRWEKDRRRGKVEMPDDPMVGVLDKDTFVAVNWKVFKHYVHANRNRILHTRKEMEKNGEVRLESMNQATRDAWDIDDEETFPPEITFPPDDPWTELSCYD